MKILDFFNFDSGEDGSTETSDPLNAQARDPRSGPERDEAERERRRLEIADHLDEWLESRGLRRPK